MRFRTRAGARLRSAAYGGGTRAVAAPCEPSHELRAAHKRFTMREDYRNAAERESAESGLLALAGVAFLVGLLQVHDGQPGVMLEGVK